MILHTLKDLWIAIGKLLRNGWMKHKVCDLRHQDLDKDVYWIENDLVVETKAGIYTYKNAKVTSISFGIDYDNGLGETQEIIGFVGNECDSFSKG